MVVDGVSIRAMLCLHVLLSLHLANPSLVMLSGVVSCFFLFNMIISPSVTHLESFGNFRFNAQLRCTLFKL